MAQKEKGTESRFEYGVKCAMCGQPLEGQEMVKWMGEYEIHKTCENGYNS